MTPAKRIFGGQPRQSETLALSYGASRVVESTIIVVGLISLLSVGTLREDFAGAVADGGSLTIAGESLVAIHDWTFLLGPGFCVGVNVLLLGYLFTDPASCRDRQ